MSSGDIYLHPAELTIEQLSKRATALGHRAQVIELPLEDGTGWLMRAEVQVGSNPVCVRYDLIVSGQMRVPGAAARFVLIECLKDAGIYEQITAS